MDLLSHYKKHLSKLNQFQDTSQSDQIKNSICYVHKLYENSEIDPSDSIFLQLVEKCKKAIESDSKTIFSNLFNLAKLIKKYSKTKNEERESELSEMSNEKEENKSEFVNDNFEDDSESKSGENAILEKKTLKFTSIKNKRVTQIELTNVKTSSDAENSEKKMSLIEKEMESNIEKNKIVSENGENAPESNNDIELKNLTNKEFRILRNIKKLDDFCLKLNEKIKEIENKEITSEELNDERSNFINEANLKKKFVEAYSKLTMYCKKFPHLVTNDYKIVKGKSWQFSKKIKFDETNYKEINSHISECLNRTRQFPDFIEVFDWVKEANQIHQLKLEDKKMYEISQFSFEKICKILKSRRIADDLRVHNSRVENLNEENPNEILAVSDPAENDKDLQAILEDNKKIFDQKYTELISSYAKKQEENENLEGEEAGIDAETDDDDDDNEEKSEEPSEKSNETINLSVLSEDLKADSNESQYSSSDSNDQIYCTPPEIKSDKYLDNEYSDKPAKRIKLETNTSSNELSDSNTKNDADSTPKKILPKIVECSSAVTEPEECIVLD